MVLSLEAENGQQLSSRNLVTLAHGHPDNRTFAGGRKLMLHFHRLDHDEPLPPDHGISIAYQHRRNPAAHGRAHLHTVAAENVRPDTRIV